VIYFVLAEGLERCKIGFSLEPKTRMYALGTSSPVSLEFLGAIEGSKEDEKVLHRIFDWLKIKGEWYKYTSPLVEFIQFSLKKGEIDRAAERRALRLKYLYQSPLDNHLEGYFEWDDWYGDYLILFGKHSGLHLCELIRQEFEYIEWMLYKAEFCERVAETTANTLTRILMSREYGARPMKL
jgi:hypothetical protein